MTFMLYRGGRPLGRVVEFGYDHEFTARKGAGRLEASDFPSDLEGSTQMRSRHAGRTVVTQFAHPPMDFDAIPRGTSGSGSSSTPGRIMDAEMAAPMRDEFVLTLHRDDGTLIEVDMIALQFIKWPIQYAQQTGLSREQWIVTWASRAT
jgi:hypothetical protein